MDFVVYTYDNLEAVLAVFNGVASIMTGNAAGFKDMVKVLGLLGLLVAIASFLVNPSRLAALSWYGGFMIVYFLLFLPVARVNVVDIGRPGHPGDSVGNVPAALALTASVTSTVGLRMTQTFETVMQALPIRLPGQAPRPANCGSPANCMLHFSGGGMMFGSKMLGRVHRAAIEGFATVDPLLEKEINEFIAQCTAYDLSQRYHGMTYGGISKALDLWDAIGDTSPARYVHTTIAGTEDFVPCPKAYEELGKRRDAAGAAVSRNMARSLFPNLTDAQAQEKLQAAYQDIATLTQLGNEAWDVKKFILQNTAINQLKRGLGRMGSEVDSPDSGMLAQAETQAVNSANTNFVIQSRLAEEALPLIRNGVEVLLYGIFPIVVLLLLVQQGPGLVSAIKGFVFALIWIQLWPPLYALVNFIGQVRSAQAARALMDAMRDAPTDAVGVALANYNSVYSGQLSDQAVTGYLVIAVPAIASAIIYGMNSAMGALGGSALIGSGGRAADAAAAGNVNFGNVSVGQQNLGPSRVDADVFQKKTTHGDFSYNARTGELLSAKLQDSSTGVKLQLDNSAIAQMQSSFTKSLGANRQELQEITNTVNDKFQKQISGNLEFAKMVAAETGFTVDKAAGVKEGAGEANNLSSKTTTTETTKKADEQSVSVSGSVEVFGLGGGPKATGSMGDERAVAGQAGAARDITVDQKAELLHKWQQREGFKESEQSSFKTSESKGMSFEDARQKIHSLTSQIQKTEQAMEALSHVSQNSASIQVNLEHEAVKRAADRLGQDAFEHLGWKEQREVIKQEGVAIMRDEYHAITDEMANRMLKGTRDDYTVDRLRDPENPNATQEHLASTEHWGSQKVLGPRSGASFQQKAEIFGGAENYMPPDTTVVSDVKERAEGALELFGENMERAQKAAPALVDQRQKSDHEQLEEAPPAIQTFTQPSASPDGSAGGSTDPLPPKSP